MISLVIVNHHSASMAAEAIRTARLSAAPLEVIVVDNSQDSHEVDELRPYADHIVVSATNRGYAGAINDARRLCSGDVMIVSNPDVRFETGALDRLVEALREGASVAGPALYWDNGYEWLLPPADVHTARSRASAILAGRFPAWQRLRDRRRTAGRIAFWSLERNTRVRSLSGAVMAIRLDAFDKVGGFDEIFRLYFEESDFLRRVEKAGGSVVYVPAARCRHIYNQSAGQDAGRASELYAQSEWAYLVKWTGPRRARIIKRLERPLAPQPASPIEGRIELEGSGMVVEASPLQSFETAAGHFANGGSVDLPDEVLQAFRGRTIFLRVVDRRSARVVAAYERSRG